jgi:hypothetical protein
MASMRRLLLALPLFVLIGCREEEVAVKLTVSYSGFKPGCVRVIAQDAMGAGEVSSTEVPGKGDVTGGMLTVAIFRAEGWGSELEVEALAYERPCPATGAPVTQQSGTITLKEGPVREMTLTLEAQDSDGDGWVTDKGGGSDCFDNDPWSYPGAPEVCDLKDNNCSEGADEGLGVDTDCANPGNCMGKLKCLSDGGVGCNSPTPTNRRYQDRDNDGFGARDAGPEDFCDLPTSGYALFNTDCDDGNPRRSPAEPERCNLEDDNCDGVDDVAEWNLGGTCTPVGGCTGGRACETDGGIRCEILTFPTDYFPDDDLDGYGRSDAGAVASCNPVPNHVPQRGDCDDGNPFTYTTAPELCDREDNDCDGAREDAGACPGGGPNWATIGALDPGTNPWNAVGVWGDGGVWIIGDNEHRVVRQPGSASFGSIQTNNCDNTELWSMWVDPTNGRAYLGTAYGNLTTQNPSSTSCPSAFSSGTGDQIRGLTGFRVGSNLEIYGVARNGTTGSGRIFRWDGGTQVQTLTSGLESLYNIHGLSRDQLFAAGGPDDSPRIYRFNPSNGQWVDENVQGTTTGAARLEDVRVVNSKLAFAVGWNGTVLRWNGTTWTKLAFPNSTERLSAVHAFGANSVYAASRAGRVFRYNGTQWSEEVDGGAILYDIAGQSPEDIWIVGNEGRVLHWPQ